jgi:hypothetical protein
VTDIDDVPLRKIRSRLAELIAIADTAERPKPTRVNPADHPMPGQEWTVVEQQHPYTTRQFPWVIRAVDDPEYAGTIYLSTPDSTNPGEDFQPVDLTDARRIALAILAACDRSDHVLYGVTRLEDHRPDPAP